MIIPEPALPVKIISLLHELTDCACNGIIKTSLKQYALGVACGQTVCLRAKFFDNHETFLDGTYQFFA